MPSDNTNYRSYAGTMSDRAMQEVREYLWRTANDADRQSSVLWPVLAVGVKMVKNIL
jgi:hypothetical protein